MFHRLLILALTGYTTLYASVEACNPLSGKSKNIVSFRSLTDCTLAASCTPNPGLASPTYTIDFTKETALPTEWTLANYETVDFTSKGAEFTFAKRNDAPYMWTSFYFFFGHIDVVMQAAPGTGIISSSVLLSDDLDEIDWVRQSLLWKLRVKPSNV